VVNRLCCNRPVCASSSAPLPAAFKEEIIQAFYQGIKDKPQTTFGNVKADVIKDKQPDFQPLNFCEVIRASRWP